MSAREWINDINTVSFRILTSIGLAVFLVFVLTIAIVVVQWEPSDNQIKVLLGIAASVLTMMGFDVLQYSRRRETDIDYTHAKARVEAAKNPNTQQINAPAATDINVQPQPIPPAPRPASFPASPLPAFSAPAPIAPPLGFEHVDGSGD